MIEKNGFTIHYMSFPDYESAHADFFCTEGIFESLGVPHLEINIPILPVTHTSLKGSQFKPICL